MAFDREAEYPKILTAAVAHGVDPRFITAIRRQENGAPGREFGVLSEKAPTYDDQLRICCETVAHAVMLWTFPLCSQTAAYRLRYSPGFVSFFGKRWAPTGVANDPNHLNENWIPDVLRLYAEEVA